MVYAEVGSSFQQVGGTCPDGWVAMSGFRPQEGEWVAGSDGEWCAPQPPAPTMAGELRAEQEATALLIQQNSQRWVAAASTPGADREAKVAAIEEDGVQIRDTHKANVVAIKNKWVAALTKPAAKKSTTS